MKQKQKRIIEQPLKEIDLIWGKNIRQSIWDIKRDEIKDDFGGTRPSKIAGLSNVATFISKETAIPEHEVLLVLRLFWEYIACKIHYVGIFRLWNVGVFKATANFISFRSRYMVATERRKRTIDYRTRYNIPRSVDFEITQFEEYEMVYGLWKNGKTFANSKAWALNYVRAIMKEKLGCYIDSYKDILTDHFQTQEFADWCNNDKNVIKKQSERLLDCVDTIKLSFNYAKKDFERIISNYRDRRYDNYISSQQSAERLRSEQVES